MQIDKNAKLKADMDKTLVTSNFNLKPDIWCWMMLEIVGNQMVAQVSGGGRFLMLTMHALIFPRTRSTSPRAAVELFSTTTSVSGKLSGFFLSVGIKEACARS